jgi:hypothetical protein
MVSEEKLLGNFFKDEAIINDRMYNFSLDSLNKLTAANGGGDYDDLIALITPLIDDLGIEIGDVDIAANILKGKTMTADQVMTGFGTTMKDKEGVIADALGGRTTPAYLQFYPNGFGEYTRASKLQMPSLTVRVKTAATANSAALGAPLTALLQAFKGAWETARNAQEQQKGVLDDNRTERSESRVALELGMLTTVHTVAAKFPGDVDACNNFFTFNLLFSHGHRSSVEVGGEVGILGSRAIANRTFTDSMDIELRNVDFNADVIIAIVHTATDPPGPKAKRVKPQHGLRVKPSEIGELTDTFLVIYNASDVNTASYFVKILGINSTEEED